MRLVRSTIDGQHTLLTSGSMRRSEQRYTRLDRHGRVGIWRSTILLSDR